jgi:hypothetical protein
LPPETQDIESQSNQMCFSRTGDHRGYFAYTTYGTKPFTLVFSLYIDARPQR